MQNSDPQSFLAYDDMTPEQRLAFDQRQGISPGDRLRNELWLSAAEGSITSKAPSGGWKLKRTAQCSKCPWLEGVDPHDIPNGYCETKHKGLVSTIANPGDISTIGQPLHAMACHETHDVHCVGWLHNQLGEGNNIALRLRMINCENAGAIRLRGPQHACFEDTLPNAKT